MKKKDIIIEEARKVGLHHLMFKKDGNIKAMKGYYYRGQGGTIEALKEKVKTAFPNAEITGDGDEFKPFIGGAPIHKQSHIWVTFKLPLTTK